MLRAVLFEPMVPDLDDQLTPRAMTEPRVLYRSMALEELGEVMRTGRVTGGGAHFNWAERRPYAFFGDVLNDHLLSHGEHVERRVVFAMRDHPLEVLSRTNPVARKSVAKRIRRELRRDGIRCDRQDLENFVTAGAEQSMRSVVRSIQRASNCDRAKYARLFQAHRRIMREGERNCRSQNILMRTLFSEYVRKAANQPYSSAVIVTRPISGGLEYREQSLNDGQAEYCFRPGQVTVGDVSQILLIKAGKVVRTLNRERFGEVQGFVEEAIRVEPADDVTLAYGSPERGSATIRCKAGEDVRWETKTGLGWLYLHMPWLFFG